MAATLAWRMNTSEAMLWGNLELLHSQWLWLLPLFIGVTALLRRQLQRGQASDADCAELIFPGSGSRLGFLHPLIGRLTAITPRQKSHKANSIMQFLILICFLLALAEPVLRGERLAEPPRERDIVFIVDTSVSMILRDYLFEGQRIERMSLLKGLLDRFVQTLKGERMGVIVFGENAYSLVPLTADQSLIRSMLRRIKTTMAGRYNAIGDAIGLAVKQASEHPQRKRVLILLSAANQPTGHIAPMQAAEYARQAHLPLYTVAIGATDFTAQDARDSGLIYQPVNVELLQSLATHTGAQYYLANDTQSLEQAISAIEKNEANVTQHPAQYRRVPLYQWPLAAGLLLFSVLQLWNYYRYWREVQRG